MKTKSKKTIFINMSLVLIVANPFNAFAELSRAGIKIVEAVVSGAGRANATGSSSNFNQIIGSIDCGKIPCDEKSICKY